MCCANRWFEINEKTWQFTTSYKDDCSKISELKQQISQFTKDDITSQRIAEISLCWELISSFVIFAVLVLRFCCSSPCKLSSFFINICCFGGMYWAILGIFKVLIKQPRQTCGILSNRTIRDRVMTSYPYQGGGHSIAILLPLSVFVISLIWKGPVWAPGL